MRTAVGTALALLALVEGAAPARKPRCQVSFTQATREHPRCAITAPCIEGRPCASMARFVECGETVRECGRTFTCRCPGPAGEPTPH